MTRKNVYSEQKVLTQIDILLPVERRAPTTNSWHACKHIRTLKNSVVSLFEAQNYGCQIAHSLFIYYLEDGYKDPCDRTFFSIKCVYEFAPSEFAYP